MTTDLYDYVPTTCCNLGCTGCVYYSNRERFKNLNDWAKKLQEKDDKNA